jgi:competence protein ComEC
VSESDVSPGRVLSDRVVVLLSVIAWVGAALALPVPAGLGVGLGVVIAAAACCLRRPLVLVVGVALLSTSLAHRAWSGTQPVRPAVWSGTATLSTDPEPIVGAVRVVAVVDGRRVEAWARGSPARALRPRLAGEKVDLTGELSPPRPELARRLAVRHIVGRMVVHRVDGWQPGAPPWRAANALRRLLEDGSVSLPSTSRSLLAGLVLGDDRHQPDELATAFEAAGLTHLLAVSGQNVAFVLAVAGPCLQRLGLRTRLLATLGVLGFFMVVTRFEPSVLRAVAMASAAAFSAALGRPASGVRLLGLAVTGLVLVDPLLVHSLGFQLSVLATAGIIVAAPGLARRLPAPRWLALPLSVTLAAQLATAPLVIARFGSVPLASVPANLLAEPAAGAAMVYGLAGGLAAGVLRGLFGPWPAAVVHLPTRVMMWWLAGVARWAADLPLGSLGVPGLGLVALCATAMAVRAHCGRRATVASVVPPAGSRPP